MQDPAFAAPGQFWRGNLHTHSDRSDGALSPEEVCRRYRAEGYDFIALTDHFMGRFDYPIVDTTPYRDAQFTTILGAELHSGAMENGDIWHILAVGLPRDFAPTHTPLNTPVPDQETGPEVAQRARDAGAFIAVAHPEWGGLTLNDVRSISAAHAIEIYNHGCYVDCDRAEGLWHLDRLLEEGHRRTVCATDDAHFSTPDHFGGWTMVKAKENTPEALLAALKAGHMYATTGPQIHDLHWGAESVTVACSPAARVIVQGQKAAAHAEHGAGLTRVTIPYDTRVAQSPWRRVTVVDAAGQRAWSNPFWAT